MLRLLRQVLCHELTSEHWLIPSVYTFSSSSSLLILSTYQHIAVCQQTLQRLWSWCLCQLHYILIDGKPEGHRSMSHSQEVTEPGLQIQSPGPCQLGVCPSQFHHLLSSPLQHVLTSLPGATTPQSSHLLPQTLQMDQLLLQEVLLRQPRVMEGTLFPRYLLIVRGWEGLRGGREVPYSGFSWVKNLG